jgi:hypothetical protein
MMWRAPLNAAIFDCPLRRWQIQIEQKTHFCRYKTWISNVKIAANWNTNKNINTTRNIIVPCQAKLPRLIKL